MNGLKRRRQLIDQEKKQALLTGVRTSRQMAIELLTGFTSNDLAAIKEILEEIIPTKSLQDINLEHELMLQLETVKKLQREVAVDSAVPANQRAQVANAVAGTLQQLIKMQTEFNTSERFKAIEALMIKAMKSLPQEVAEKFIEEYERMAA